MTEKLPIDKNILREPYRQAVPESIEKLNSPVLQNVIVTERWRVWDGVLSGICEIDGNRYYFEDIVESIWRFYDHMQSFEYDNETLYVQNCDRLWRIFAVYLIDETIKSEEYKEKKWPIGIFWDYELKLVK